MQFSHLDISGFFTSSPLGRLLQQQGVWLSLAGCTGSFDGSDPLLALSLWVFDHGWHPGDLCVIPVMVIWTDESKESKKEREHLLGRRHSRSHRWQAKLNWSPKNHVQLWLRRRQDGRRAWGKEEFLPITSPAHQQRECVVIGKYKWKSCVYRLRTSTGSTCASLINQHNWSSKPDTLCVQKGDEPDCLRPQIFQCWNELTLYNEHNAWKSDC